jgi:hypothetical protein
VTFRDTSPVTAASPEFTLPYDRLVCSVGAPFNTFGIPGVERFAFQLKVGRCELCSLCFFAKNTPQTPPKMLPKYL